MKLKHIYGPVQSWRLGKSLGIDPLSDKEKICNFNCIYCQLGKTPVLHHRRQIFVPTEEIIKEMRTLPPLAIDHITISGRGEPTLAENLGEIIQEIRNIRCEKIAVITNSSLMDREDVQQDLSLADYVIAKLDVSTSSMLAAVNQVDESIDTFDGAQTPPFRAGKGAPLSIKPEHSPAFRPESRRIDFTAIVSGLHDFRNSFPGRLAIQVMLVDQNKYQAGEIAQLVKQIGPDEVQINTPLRPSASRPLRTVEIEAIKVFFKGLNVISVYDVPLKKTEPIDVADTLLRHGNYQK